MSQDMEMPYEPSMFMDVGPTSLDNIVYKLNDGRMWDTKTAQWVTEAPAGIYPLELYSDGKPAGEKYLIECLEFYNFPLGELLTKSAVGLKKKLQELDEQYLNPRTMAGLTIGDAIAKASWDEHERLAAPYRAALAALDPAGSDAKAKLKSLKEGA